MLGASAGAEQAPANLAANVSRPTGFNLSQEQIMPTGAETKNRTFVQQPPAQRSGLILPLPRYRTAAKDVSDPLEGFALRPGCDPEAAIS